MTANLLRLALNNIRSRRTRSWLTILGVLVGVTAVVALLSIGTGVQEAVLKQFEDIGYDIILIAPRNAARAGGDVVMQGAFGQGRFAQGGQSTDAAGTASSQFSPGALTGTSSSDEETQMPFEPPAAFAESTRIDTALLVEQVPQLVEAGTLGTQILSVQAGTTGGFLRVSTPSLDFLDSFSSVLGGFQIASGTTFTNTTENQVVVGARTAETLDLAVGDHITIGGIDFSVVGILVSSGQEAAPEEEGSPLSGAGLTQSLGSSRSGDLILRGMTNTDDSLFILAERANELLAGRTATSVTITRVEPGASISDAMTAITYAIGQQGATGTPISIQEVADEIQGTLGLIETVLASIAAVALIVGGVGLMNTMYTAVLERTREIGVLKSVGARDSQILALFLVDSGLMGLIGGILGLILGAVLSLFGTRLLGPSLGVGSFAPIVSAWLVFGVLGFSFLLGGLSGAWPAWRAARLNPVEALAAE
jgi:putative ABC transport system permease protein